VKQALKNIEFRRSLPTILKNEIQKYEQNPDCPCNLEIYRQVLKHGVKELKEYYSSEEIVTLETPKLSENHWLILDCAIQELQVELRKLKRGRKQIAIARFEDRVSVIINELDALEDSAFLIENHWKVINCNVNDLENEIKNLSPGKKQLVLSRYKDEVTVIINELGLTE
jgi:hypothetical protein